MASLTSLTSAVGRAYQRFRNTKAQCELEKRFLAAAEQNNVAEINRCITAGVNPNCKDGDLSTALHIATERLDVRLASKLLTCPNILINLQNYYGLTPLHIACKNEQVKMVKCLLNHGADPNVRDRFDKTPLHMVVLSNSMTIVRLLVQNGAEVNVIDSMDNTPLHIAAIVKCFLPMIKLLFEYGADPNIDTGNMSLFLECVLACNTTNMLQAICCILDHDVFINKTDKIAKRNALHFVAITGYSPLAIKLLQRGCDPFMKDFMGKKPIDIAISHENEEVAYILECHMYPSQGVSIGSSEQSYD